MIVKRKFFTQEGGGEKKKNDNSADKQATGALLISGGALTGNQLLKTLDKDRLTGKVTRWHATNEDLLDKIKQEGLRANAANGDTFTKEVLQHINPEELDNKIYLGKSRTASEGVANVREMRGKGRQGMLELDIDYDDYKKMKKVSNPELLGAKSEEEYLNKLVDNLNKKNGTNLTRADLKPYEEAYRQNYRAVGEGTDVIGESISSKYIKGGKGYEKRGIKRVGKYIKNNPGRFGKEAAKIAVPAAIIGTGAVLATKGLKEEYNRKGKK